MENRHVTVRELAVDIDILISSVDVLVMKSLNFLQKQRLDEMMLLKRCFNEWIMSQHSSNVSFITRDETRIWRVNKAIGQWMACCKWTKTKQWKSKILLNVFIDYRGALWSKSEFCAKDSTNITPQPPYLQKCHYVTFRVRSIKEITSGNSIRVIKKGINIVKRKTTIQFYMQYQYMKTVKAETFK